MKKKINQALSAILTVVILLQLIPLASAVFIPVKASAEGSDENGAIMTFGTGIEHNVRSDGNYVNWSGVSNTVQFKDENGNFCLALDGNGEVTILKTNKGCVISTLKIKKEHTLLGTVVCDESGNIYVVYGEENKGDDRTAETIFISKYDKTGTLITTVGGCGKEGLASWYDDGFYTKIPFNAGNCDAAINGNILLVNYARKMYNGHQSNALFAIETDTMKKAEGFVFYNSHSFDQRVTPYGKNGGFLLESHGDSYNRTFTTALTDMSSVKNEMDTFDFWVQQGAHDEGNMYQLNRTYARLGNILETSRGAALIAVSARSLSEAAIDEPYDLFVQVFDPFGDASDANSYVTSGERSGTAGNNGDKEVTNHGVKWLSDLNGSGMSIEKVQAINADPNTVFVLYEMYSGYNYVSTYYMILAGDGSVLKEPASLGSIRLNTDEDPVFADGAVQWASNAEGSNELKINALFRSEEEKKAFSDFESSGACGENAAWEIDENGALRITGSGKMTDFADENGAPWNLKRFNIKSIIIESGITSVGSFAFSGCGNAAELVVPDSVTSVGDFSFLNCGGLKKITLPDKLSKIGSGAFFGCAAVPDIIIPKSVSFIGRSSFSGCVSLNGVIFFTDNAAISEGAFEKSATFYCHSGSTAEAYAKKNSLNTKPLTADNKIAEGTCGKSLKWDIDIEFTLTISGKGTMTDFTDDSPAPWSDHKAKIKKLFISSGVGSIGDNAFAKIDQLTEVDVPDGVISIGDNAFCDCQSLVKAKISDTVMYIGDDVFKGTAIYNNASNRENGVLYIGKHLITADSGAVGTEYTVKPGTLTIASYAFAFCSKLEKIDIPDSVQGIGQKAFYGTALLNDKTKYQDGVLYIGKHLIKTDSGALSGRYTVKEGTLTIAGDAFYNCYKLSAVTLPDSVVSVGKEAFDLSYVLSGILIPESVRFIGSGAFNKCDSLTVYCYSECYASDYAKENGINYKIVKDGAVKSGTCGEKAYWSIDLEGTLTVSGSGKTDNYYSSDDVPWLNERRSIEKIIIKDGITSIGSIAFFYFTSLEKAYIPDSVTSIGSLAFAYCDKMTILCHEGSFAESYAKENGINYSIIQKEPEKVEYKTEDGFITGVKPGTDLDKFISLFGKEAKVFDKNGGEMTGGTVCTGFTAKSGGDTFIIIIKGDTDGNGKIDSTDYIMVKRHFLKISLLDGAYKKAADTDGNNAIDATDYIAIKRHILGISSL